MHSMGLSTSTELAAISCLPRCHIAEARVLSAAAVPVDAYDVKIPSSPDYGAAGWLHTIEHCGGGEPLCILPGFMAGAALWARVLPDIGQRCFVVDPLGTGLSARLEWTPGTSVDKAEAWFATSLDAWRQAMGLERFALAAHSLGACFAMSYVERFPQRVSRLILLSPVGVPERPVDYIERLSDRAPCSIQLAYMLWERGWTPHDALRFLGPARKFAAINQTQRWHCGTLTEEYYEAAVDYLDATWGEGDSSGAHALNAFLHPGAWGKRPLARRIPCLPIRTDFIYGSQDWMDYRHALQLTGVGVSIIGGGHQFHMENPEGCARAIKTILVSHSVERLTLENLPQDISEVATCRNPGMLEHPWRNWEGYDFGR